MNEQRIYRIHLHCTEPLRFGLTRLNEHGLEIRTLGEHYYSVNDARSIAQLGLATEIIVTPAAQRADQERRRA